MNIQSVLHEGYSILYYAEVETPILDATVLLSEAIGFTKEKLLESLPDEIDSNSYNRFKHFLDLRCSGVPVSYIRHKKEFFGLEFYVDERVLVPRPDTETLVEAALERAKTDRNINNILDICTGSGCVAIALKYTFRELNVSASDISGNALDVCVLNSRKILGVSLTLYLSDLFNSIPGKYDIITGNPPYLLAEEMKGLKKLKWPEPKLALYGGKDGIETLKKIIEDAPLYLNSGGYLMLEAAEVEMSALSNLMTLRGYDSIYKVKDLAGRDRVICGRYSSTGKENE